MKVKRREAYNFKDLVKSFFGNGVASIEDENIEQEVENIIKQQNNDFIKQLEKAVSSTENSKNGRKNGKIDVKTMTTRTVERNSAEHKIKEEERERE